MQKSTCKHCGVTIYLDEEDPVSDRRDTWSSNKIWYETWCSRADEIRHEPVSETSPGGDK